MKLNKICQTKTLNEGGINRYANMQKEILTLLQSYTKNFEQLKKMLRVGKRAFLRD